MEKDKYKELFERSADAILIIRDGKFVDCNAATVKMLCYSNKQELLNTHPSQLSPERQPDGRMSYEKANEIIKIAFKKGSHRFEWNHKKANGDIFPVEVLLTAVTDGINKTLHVVWRDISERKQREKALHNNIELLDSIFTNLPICVKLIKKDGTLIDMNPSGLSMVGALSKNDVIGKNIYDLIADEDRNDFIRFNETICSGKEAGLTFKINALDGNVHHMDSKAVPIHYGPKNEIIQLGITRDITKQVKNRVERQALRNQLHQAQKMEAIGTLAGGIAHDFNNILSGIFGFSQLAKDYVNDPVKVKIYIEEIISGSKKAAELVQQILTFSRKSTNEKKPVKIHIIIKEALKLLRASLPSTIDIKGMIDSHDMVMADPTKIHQVIMNLCTNAYHAMSDTGGTLSVALKQIKKGTGTPESNLPPKDYIRLEVKDTGRGMTKETIEKIFDPYFTTKDADKGTGLGLAVVHAIIEEHNGLIKVDSVEGKGSSFKIFLPITTQKTILQSKETTKTPLCPGRERIMLVDDEKNIRESTKSLLEHYGYIVRSFSNGMDALEVFKNDPLKFDLVISDITMPGMTGDIFSANLLELRPDLPIILCSGFSEKISEREMTEIGIKKFLQKPILSHELASEIQKILSKKS
ncbi:MAG: PAS domain S-box protein [Deltaproteobacteria bacterium]|nr:PAS domain S-box protein [Deltaproteobacteria bacterium]